MPITTLYIYHDITCHHNHHLHLRIPFIVHIRHLDTVAFIMDFNSSNRTTAALELSAIII